MKPFLLIAGDWYYPASGIGNWIDTFSSKEEALQKIKVHYDDMSKDRLYKINDVSYEWYEIVDLREWVNR